MYSIYCDGQPVYVAGSPLAEYAAIDPVLRQEARKAASLSFTIPLTEAAGQDARYQLIRLMASEVLVYDDADIVFRGRCVERQRSLNGRVTYRCASDLSFLQDSIIPPFASGDYTHTIAGFISFILSQHNAQVDANRRLTYVNDDPTSPAATTWMADSSDQYMTAWDALNTYVFEPHSTWLYAYTTVTPSGSSFASALHVAMYSTVRQINIDLGRNLLSYSDKENAEDVYTVIEPIGADGLTIASVNSGSTILTSSAGVALWGRIRRRVEFPSIDNAADLKTAAQAELDAAIASRFTVDAKVVPDSNTDGAVRVGTRHRIVHGKLGVNAFYPCWKSEIYLDRADRSAYGLGVQDQPLTGRLK